MEWQCIQILFLVLASTSTVDAGINCYVCDTTDVSNENPQVCDDTFLLNRGAQIETGCAACTKEKIFNSGVMIIKRSCERSLRWESTVWTCNRNQETEYVFGISGTRCVCLTDLCNTASHIGHSVLPVLLLTMLGSKLIL